MQPGQRHVAVAVVTAGPVVGVTVPATRRAIALSISVFIVEIKSEKESPKDWQKMQFMIHLNPVA